MRTAFVATGLFCLCAVLSAVARGGGDLDELIATTVKAYGGAERLRNASAVRETGKVAARMRGGMEGELVREFERPDRLRVVIRYGTGTEVRVYDGKTGWREGRVVTGPPLDAMVLQAARLALPLILLDRKAEIVDRGSRNVDGMELRTLDLPLGNGLNLTVGIDPGSGRIVLSSGTGGPGADGRPLEFVTRYGDFRIVDNVLHAFREENYAGGFPTGETTLHRVEHLESFPGGTFRP